MAEQGSKSMDTKTKELVARLTKERNDLKDELDEAHALNTVLLGQLMTKGMDPDHLAA